MRRNVGHNGHTLADWKQMSVFRLRTLLTSRHAGRRACRKKENENVFFVDWQENVDVSGTGTMKTETNEARRHARHELATCAWLRFPGDNGSHGVVSVDLSREGARFTALGPVEPGTRVLVYQQLGGQAGTIECKARVCWCRLMDDGLYHFGARFVDLCELEAEQLTRTLDETVRPPALAAV